MSQRNLIAVDNPTTITGERILKKIMSDYLYMKTMNEFLDRLTNQIDELPKIPQGSLLK